MSASRRRAAAVLVVVLALAGVGSAVALSRTGAESGQAPTGPPPAATARAQTPPGDPGALCEGPNGYPAPECTGVPPDTVLTDLPLNFFDSYRVTTPGEVVDGKRIRGNLLVTAPDVVVRNSVVEANIYNHYDDEIGTNLQIADTTVGPESGCLRGLGVGYSEYSATRVHIQNYSDGFRISGQNVTLLDNLVTLCSQPGDHADGVEDNAPSSNVVIRRNTFDLRNAPHSTAPIFMVNTAPLLVEDNLIMGGGWSLRVYNALDGEVEVRDNRAVEGEWSFGPLDGEDCAKMTFTGNEVVRIDDGYRVVEVVEPLPCE